MSLCPASRLESEVRVMEMTGMSGCCLSGDPERSLLSTCQQSGQPGAHTVVLEGRVITFLSVLLSKNMLQFGVILKVCIM